MRDEHHVRQGSRLEWVYAQPPLIRVVVLWLLTLGVLFASFGAVLGMLGLNKLPQWYHACFKSERFSRVTDDRFFICVEAADPKYDVERTKQLLLGTGAIHIEEVED